MVNNPEVAAGIGKKETYSYDQEKEWVKSRLNKNAICYSMLEKGTGDFIGNIEIVQIVDGVGEIGISITALKQNQHFGTEAIKAFIKYSREELGVKDFDLNVFKTNSRAIHLYEKLGFVKDGAGRKENDFHMTYMA